MDRVKDWEKFNTQIEAHIINYTIPQYRNEDTKTDQVGAWTSQDCINAIQRYVNRYGKNIRGKKEALRDMLKIAHYAQFSYDKLKTEMNEPDVY